MSSPRPPGLISRLPGRIGVRQASSPQSCRGRSADAPRLAVRGDRLSWRQSQALDPVLRPIWKAAIVTAVGIGTACSIVVWTRRRRTTPYVIMNTVANCVGAVVIIVLTVEGELFAPTLTATTFERTTDLSVFTDPFLLLVAAIAIWDSVDGILRARRGRIDRAVRSRRADPPLHPQARNPRVRDLSTPLTR